MRGAPARAIQELAGHMDLSMTQRYMHLSPAALDSAIRLLEQPAGPARSGRNVADATDARKILAIWWKRVGGRKNDQ